MPTFTKRKMANSTSDKLDSVSTPLERDKVSKTGNVCGNENFPNNKQVKSAIRTVETTISIMSCDDDQKHSKKKRLNLSTRTAVSKGTKTIKQKLQTALEDIDSSEDTESPQSLSVKSNLKHNLHKRNDVINDGESDSIGTRKEMEEPPNSSIKCCPICKYDFTSLNSDFRDLDTDAEINEHINKCLDGAKSETKTETLEIDSSKDCQLCGKDISKYNTVQRQQHINRCCDKSEETQLKTKPEVSSILCPICGKHFKTTKTRQTHMKKCAKANSVSTSELVELNRQQNINNPTITETSNSLTTVSQKNNTKSNEDSLGFVKMVKNYKRKRKANLPAKNLDEDTQLALALSASMDSSDASDVREIGTKRRKKKKGNSELPALLLRSDDEMKKVTEARAAAILCQWADNDDEIQCTPALAPSSLVTKYGKESDTEHLEILKQTAECDVEDLIERCDSPIIEVRAGSHSKKNEKCGCANESESFDTVATQDKEIKKYFTIDKESRLWNLASLQAGVVTHEDFFVPNLLPKPTPRKKKATRSANSVTIEEQLNQPTVVVEKDNKDVCKVDSPSEVSRQNDEFTESQQKDIEMLVELINDDSSDTHSTGNEKEQNEEIEKTWFPSSGFCVRKDLHENEGQNKEEVDKLLSDLSCMVGNPLLSDVEIIAKNNKKFAAHSTLLSARCATLAEILHTSDTCIKDDDSNGLVCLELPDIDVRAVRAVLTYIYTACFIPVVENVIEDVKYLVHRWNLNCDASKWEVIRDGIGQDNKDENGDKGDLDVLLKSLWEGEEEIVSDKNENENKFGDSILDDELGDMEIKIYTQATPQKNIRESINKSAVVLDLDQENKAVAIVNRKINEDEAVLRTSDNINCIPETPLKLSPCYLPEKNNAEERLGEDNEILVEQPVKDKLETKTSQSICSDDTNIVETYLRCHSSSSPKEFNGDELDHINSSPISPLSASSQVEMISSPERSPLPENLNDFYMEDESNELFVMENSPKTSVSNSPSMNVDSCVNACISIVSPESRSTTSPIYSPITKNNVTTADKDKVNEAGVFSGFESGNSMLVDQPAVEEPCRTRKKKSDENKDDSLLDIFETSSVSRAEQSPVYKSKEDMNIDNCSDIDISILSPKSIATSPPLYSSNSKEECVGMKEAKTKLRKGNSHPKDRHPCDTNSTHRAKQSLVFTLKHQNISKEVDSNQENRIFYDENKTPKESTSLRSMDTPSNDDFYDHHQSSTSRDVNDTLRKQSCTGSNKDDSWLDDSSLDTKNTSSSEGQSNRQGNCYDHDKWMIPKSVNETITKQSFTITDKTANWLDDSSLDIKNTSSTRGQSDRQGEICHDKLLTPKPLSKTITKQSSTITNKTDNLLDDSSIESNNTSNIEAQNLEENFYDDDQFIDCYDDGGFNCDIDDYFSYDAHSTTAHDNVVPDDEKARTSSLTVQDTMESNVEEETKNNQKAGKNSKEKIGKAENSGRTRKNKEENTIKDVKKAKRKDTDGKPKKSGMETADKQVKAKSNPHQEFKLRDPRTPMLDYSNMATPELKGELKQYGVRPLAKRKMVIKLKEIYNYTHAETQSESDEDDEKKSSENKKSSEDEEPRSEDTNSQQGSTRDTESCSDSEQNWYEKEQPSDDGEMLSQQSSSNLSKTLMSFLTQDHELYSKILKFTPISVSDVLETIKGNGIKCSAEQLKNFFDEQCITYSEPRPARVQRRRGRRGKTK